MSMELQRSQVYTDFQGLTDLRAQARGGSPEALVVAAKQFEAYLVQQLLRASREANPDGGLFGDEGGGLYQDMFDKQMALSVTAGQGLGVAEMLVQQLGGRAGIDGTAEAAAPAQVPAAVPPRQADASPPPATAAEVLQRAGAVTAAQAGPTGAHAAGDVPVVAALSAAAPAEPTPARFEDAQAFVAAVMPHAQRVGAELGVDPRLLVAQAALETGWGRSIIRNEDGSSSHNLFNIKAHRAWDGPVASVRTMEYIGGSETMVQAEFRSYDSFEHSFRDYVDFLQTNPRYGDALTQTHDPEAFARSLQAAGYATDPAYADKIMRIYGTERLASAIG